MNKLDNGAVLPSGLLGVDERSEIASFNRTHKNFPLRAGLIVATYPKKHDKNVTKLATEYDVLVIEQDENRGMTALTYRNCLSMDGIGGIADFFEKRLRRQTKAKKFKGKTFQGQDGVCVYLLCLDAQSEKGVIIGGATHPDRGTVLPDDPDKAHLEGEYNGVNFKVEDDGSFTLKFRGATNSEGKPKDSKAGDTTLKIEKDGSYDLKHKGASHRLQKDGEVTLTAEKSEAHTVKQNFSVKAGKDITTESSGDTNQKMKQWLLEATGSANLRMASLTMESKGAAALKGSTVSIEASSMANIKGSVVTLSGSVFLGGAGGLPMVILTTKYIGIGNLGAPVVSSAVGPFSTKAKAV